MKEEFGAQLENNFYDDMIAFVKETFQNTFKCSIVFEKMQMNIEYMGWFQIYFKYEPRQYDLVFENDRNKFTIDIFDNEGAKTTLYRLSKFENGLTTANIKEAILKLEKILEQNDICFYIHRNQKLYKKSNGEYKRIKNLNGLR